ncbi:MAG TPA: small ribosomal subunit Rsm22 family protein [Streptosporangiaceae bacterium]
MSGSGTGLAAPSALAAAIETGLAGAGVPALTAGMQRLMAAYRSGENPARPVLATRTDVAAYAAYRMPATAAAAVLALQQTRLSVPAWRPATLLDFGAGTGSMAWAAAVQLPSITAMTLLEQSPEAIRLGRSVLAATELPALRSVRWRAWQLASGDAPTDRDGGLAADLASASYVLGELTQPQQAALVGLAISAAPAVLLIEPGTPAGHRRILAAREQLLAAGYLPAAPCPHEYRCPLQAAGDWCHFGARLPRSGLHRQVKGADLGYEDEKFSYIAAVRPEVAGRPDRPPGRIVRRPQQRKGLVTLELCREDGSTGRAAIGKSAGETYRRARKAAWGDGFVSSC